MRAGPSGPSRRRELDDRVLIAAALAMHALAAAYTGDATDAKAYATTRRG